MSRWQQPPHKTTVFLDTTVFESELFDFDSRHLKAVCSLVRDGFLRVLLTDVTRREVEAHIDEAVQSAIRGLSAFRKDRKHGVLRHYGETFKSLYEKHDVALLATQLKERFQKFCDSADVEILPTSDLQVGPLLEKYFAGHAPFSPGRKKNEFPDAIAALALERWMESEKRAVFVVSSDKDWQKLSESNKRFGWDETVAIMLSNFPDAELSATIKQTLLDSTDFQNELCVRFADMSFYVPEADGDVSGVSNVRISVRKVLVTGAKDGTATADVTVDLSYRLKLTYQVPGTGMWDLEEEYVYGPDRAEAVLDERMEMSAQVELSYDEDDPSAIDVDDVTFETQEIEVDISNLLEDH